MGIKNYLRTMFAILTLICVLISTTGLAACTCQDDCQTDRNTCENGCDTTWDSCYTTCSDQRISCDTTCDNNYDSCMSGCGGDPGCEGDCEMERMICQETCSANEGECMNWCNDDQSNCYSGCSGTYDACIAGCPPPPSITHTKGRYWVNHTWVLNCTDEGVPTSYNVSINQTWHNGTATKWYNNSGLQGGVWSNAVVLAWNATSGTICSVTLSENVYLPLPLPPAPVGTGSTWDFFWVNHTWSVGSDGEWAGDTDSFNVSIETHWVNGTTKNEWVNGSLTTFYNNSLDGEYGWSNITVWSYNSTGGLSSTYIYQNVEVPIFVPPTPVNPQSTSGRFWVNHTWSPGTGHHTDSYNVSLESDGWHNGTLTTYYKELMSTNGWSNITVYAYNNTHHKLSESSLTQNVLISWTNDIFVNTSGWWRDGDTFHATAEPFSRATDNVVTGESIRVYDGTYYEAAWIFADNVTITPVSGRPIIHPSTQQGTLTIAGDNISVSGFMFKTPLQWVIGDGHCLLFYGTEGSTSSNNDFQVRRTSLAPVTAIKVINSGNCTISGGEIEVAQERGIYIDALSSGTTVTGTTIHSYYGCSPEYGLSITRSMMSDYYRQHNTITGNSMWNVGTGIAIVIVVTPGETLDVRATFDETNVVSGNSITWSNIGIKLNASGVTTAGGVLTHDGWITGDMTGNSVSSCTYGVKHLLSSITWNGSASSNTHDHYFSGDTSGSVILDPPSLANLYLADTASTCTITNTDGRMFDVCGTRHEYIDALAYAYPNGTFSRYISDSSPLQALNLLFYNDFTITPTSAPVSVSNIEFFGSACDATGGHDVEVDVASSTPANEVRFNITGDSTWINDYVDMDISGTFVKREKANIAGFVSILYTGGFSSHHFEFDEIYVPAGGGGANPFTDYSFECRAENGWDPYETTFCNWSQSKSCFGTAGGCSGGEGECGWVECGLTSESSGGVCRTGSWHTDGDYSAWIIATINCYDACEWNNDCAVTTTVYQSVDLTGIDTISFDARFREHANLVVSDCEEPGTAAIDFQQAIDMYVDGTRVWRECYGSFWGGASEGWTGWDHIEEHLDQEADVSAYTSTHDIKLVAYIAFQGTTDFATIDGWMQMQGFFDNMGVTYSVQPPGNLLYDACPYYVNHTWDTPTDGAVIDSYNVSMNSVWHNGTTDPFYNDTSLTDWWQWSNISVHSYNTTEGLSPANSSATAQLIPAIPVPADLSHTEGHIWIRHTWAPGSSFSCLCTPTQSYNVSVNDVWYNGTTDLFYDDPGLAYEEWSNITVYSYSSDAGIISNVPVTQNLKVDSPKPATPVGGTGEWGFFWVNHSWSAGSGPENSDTDSYNYSVTTHLIGGSPSTIWYNDSTNTSHNNSLGTHGWSNITVYAWNDNVTAGLSENAIYQDIKVLKYTPPDPLNIDHTHGMYWVNHTWQAGSGNVADSYNVSINGLWHNNTPTTYFNDTTVVACGWSNIIVWAWNNTEGGLSEGNVSQDVTLPEGHPAVPNSTDSTWGFYWVNHTWKEGDSYGEWCATTDAYNYSVTTHLIGGSPSTIWYNDSTNTSHNNSMGDFGWSNLSVWAWNGMGGLCGLSIAPIYQNTEVIQYTPPNPTYIHNETDQYGVLWVNFSWACDEGGRGLADSFNISVNDVWHNGTTLCDNNQPVPEDSDFEDNTLMNWNTSGTYAWTPTAYGYESTYAIWDGFTGTATGSSTVWKNITLADYGSLYFDCKTNGGTLTVYNGSETLHEITGTHDWQSIRINLTAGTHQIKFTYARPASPTPENHAWVDNVVVKQRVYGWYLANRELDHDVHVVVWAWNDTYGGLSESSVEATSVCGVGTFYDNWYILTGDGRRVGHGYNWTGSTWQSDPGIASGLGGEWCNPNPTVFRKNGTWHLIAGVEAGTFLGRTWNGSTWQSDSSIVSGLGYVEPYPYASQSDVAPTAFQKDGTWHIISGEEYGRYRGYTWTGSRWQNDSSIVSGLGTGQTLLRTTPTVFQKDGTWHLIAGLWSGAFNGFTWDGSTWQSNSSIVSGLGDIGWWSTPTVFQKDGTWHLIAGFSARRGGYWYTTYYGEFRGFTWDGSTWQSDSSIVSGLADTSYRSSPTVFYISYDIFSPTNLTNTVGFYWVNHTWDPGTGLITDSYNVSVNGIWHNETTVTYYNDTSLVAWGQWSNITVYSYNATIDKQSYICASDEVQLLPTLTPWNNFTSGSQQAFASYDRGVTVEFKCTSDADVETWTWYDVDSSSGTSNSDETTAIKTFPDWGEVTVSVRASNAYETLPNVTWIFDVHPPDDWYDPNYQVATPILVYSCCNSTVDLGWGEFPVMNYYIKIEHVDTTNCMYSDCQDVFFYDPRHGVLPFYTLNNDGSVHKTTDETVYVQMKRLTAGEQTIYMYSQCAPSRVLRANQFGGHASMPSVVEKEFYCTPPCDDSGDLYLNGGSMWLKRYNPDSSRCERDGIYSGHVGSQVDWTCSDICGSGGLRIYGGRTPMYDTDLFLIQYGGAGVGLYISSNRLGYYGHSWVWGESCWVSFGGHNTVIPDGSGTYSFLVTGRWGDLSVGGTPARFSIHTDQGFGNEPCQAHIYTIYYTFSQDPNPCAVESYFGYAIDEPCPVIVVYDLKGNMAAGINYMIYDNDNSEVYSPWTTDDDGAVYLNDPADRNITFMVRTYAGVFTQEFSLTSGALVNTTVPVTYNLRINAYDAGGRQLDETICTLSEYTFRDPGFFWGLAMGNRTSVRMRDLSSFGTCDITVEKAGYEQYNATNMTWTTQSTMISDYKQDVTLETE